MHDSSAYIIGLTHTVPRMLKGYAARPGVPKAPRERRSSPSRKQKLNHRPDGKPQK
jgi:hypothetical protein